MTEDTHIFAVPEEGADSFTDHLQCLNCEASLHVREFFDKPIPDRCPSCQMSAKEYWEKNQ